MAFASTSAAGAQLVDAGFDGDGSQVVASSDSGSSGQSAHTSMRCHFDCGPYFRMDQLTQTGPGGCYMCIPCNSARRAIESAMNKNPASKMAKDDMKKNNVPLWKAKIRSLRIRDDGQCGVPDNTSRTAGIASWVKNVTAHVTLQEVDEIAWLTKSEFRAHYKWQHDITDQGLIERKFNEVIQNPSIPKRNVGAVNVRVPVMLAPRTQGLRGRTVAELVSKDCMLGSLTELEDAFNSVSTAGVSSESLQDASVFGQAGQVFMPGVATSLTGAIEQLHEQPASLVSVDQLLTPAQADNHALVTAAPMKRRTLTQQMSDPENVIMPENKRARETARMGVTGELLELVTRASNLKRQTHSSYAVTKNDKVKELDKILKRAEVPQRSANEAEACSKYKELIKDIMDKASKEATDAWSVTSGKQAFNILEKLVGELDEVAGEINTFTEQRINTWNSAKKVRLGQQRDLYNIRDRSCKEYVARGVPLTLARFMWSKDLLSNVVNTESEACKEPGTMALHNGADDVDPGTPVYYQKGTGGHGAQIAKLADSIGHKRLTDAVSKVKEFVTSRCPADGLAALRVQLKGTGSDTYDDFDWMPVVWRSSKIKPEHTRSFAAPWIIHGETGSFRGNLEQIPLMSLGQFVNIIEGVVMVVAWPGAAIAERGSSLANGTQFLFKDLSQQPAFDKFMSEAAQWVTLAAGQSFWIPYGWFYALVTRLKSISPASSTCLIAPVVTQAMTKTMPRLLMDEVGMLMHDFLHKIMQKKQMPWVNFMQDFKDWLEMAFALSPATAKPPSPLPIADGLIELCPPSGQNGSGADLAGLAVAVPLTFACDDSQQEDLPEIDSDKVISRANSAAEVAADLASSRTLGEDGHETQVLQKSNELD